MRAGAKISPATFGTVIILGAVCWAIFGWVLYEILVLFGLG